MAIGTHTAMGLPNTAAAPIPTGATPFVERAGLDLGYFQAQLQLQSKDVEDSLRAVQANDNLSDTERMFEMQMLMNTWSAITNLRTNMMKSVSDSLKTITRNVA